MGRVEFRRHVFTWHDPCSLRERKEVTMKQKVGLALLALLVVALLVLPFLVAAQSHSDYCYDEWERCRERAFEADVGWFKMALMLTVCDIALGKCLLQA